MKKNILAILCLLTASVNTAWADKFEIKNLADLVMFRDYVYSGEKDFANDTVIVTADIDASTTVWAYGIGMLKNDAVIDGDIIPTDDSNILPFKGLFDGQGHTIKGLKIVSENVQQSGFFACIQGATIKNLNLENCVISGKGHRVAGIVARAFGSADERDTIQNCNVINCEITCTAGGNEDFSLIGGIAGTVGYTTIEGCAVNGCIITGTTTGSTCNGAGGIVGRLNYECTVRNCTVYGGTKVYGKVKGVGAIIGEDGASVTKTVTGNTYSTNVQVNYYDTATSKWFTVDNNGLKWWNPSHLPSADYEVDNTMKERGFNLPDNTTNPEGISEANTDISKATIYLTSTSGEQRWATYDGTAKKPATVVVKVDGATLAAEKYTVTYENMIEPGVYPYGVKITGNGDYYGYVYADFTVCKSIDPTKTTTITIDPDPVGARVYTGSGLTADVDVYDGETQLTEGIDYQLLYTTTPTDETSFKTTPEIGAANAVTKVTVRIDGLGLYSEKFDKDFYIVPVEMTVDNIKYALNDKTNTVNVTGYTGTGVDIEVPATMQPDATNFASLNFDVVGITILNNTTINSVKLPASIEEIADNAFDGATNLHWIDASKATEFVPTTLSRTAAGPFKGVNPRALIFLNGTTVTGTNYIYKVAADDYQCDVLSIVDDADATQKGFEGADDTEKLAAASWGFQNPIAFKANTVMNNRKLTATVTESSETYQQGYTTCLPYSMPIPESFKAYKFIASATNKNVGFNEVTGTIEAMTPYVIIPSESGQLLKATDVTIVKTYDAVTTHDYVPTTDPLHAAAPGQAYYSLKGTMKYLPGATNMYIMQTHNEWKKIDAVGEFPNPCVLPMRAYILDEGATASPARLFSVFNNADGSTTVVKGLKLDADAASEIYDLQGRKVAAPQRGGLYIINGKKAVMK